MRRRDFIKGGALLGTGLAFGLPARAAGARSAGDRINIALIGARNMGAGTHLPTIVGSPDCQLVAICDTDAMVLGAALEKARQGYIEKNETSDHQGIDGYGDFREVLQRDDIDAVVIATPDHWHVPMAKAAVRAGKDVYVEKPLSLFIQEGRELADLLTTHSAIVQVGSQQRSRIKFLIADELIKKSALGKITHVDVGIRTRQGSAETWEPMPVPEELNYDMWLGPVPWTDYHPKRVHYDFRFVPEFSGGDLTNWGAHYLDIAQLGLGMDASGPISVRGMGQRNPAGALHTPYFDIDVDFEYANGVTMKLRTGDLSTRFVGTEGSLIVNRSKLVVKPEELLRNRSRDLEEELRRTGGHFENWLSCIRSRDAADLRAPVEIGHRSATVCHLANIGIELGRPLYWDPALEVFKKDAHANAMLNRPTRTTWAG
jgi:predicted dehydrogenase